jgi:hypothetical protein
MQLKPSHFGEVWFVDFEFRALGGALPEPICMVAYELHFGANAAAIRA